MLVFFNKDVRRRRRNFGGSPGLAWGLALGVLGVDLLGVFFDVCEGPETTGSEDWGVAVGPGISAFLAGAGFSGGNASRKLWSWVVTRSRTLACLMVFFRRRIREVDSARRDSALVA